MTIDGNPPVDVDCSSPERIPDALCYSKSDLPLKQHTVQICLAPGAKGDFIEVKRLILFESARPEKGSNSR